MNRKKDLVLILLSTLVTLSVFKLFEPSTEKDIAQAGGGFQEATALEDVQFMCTVNELECIKEISTAFSLNGNHKSLLILGNSQLGAINQMSNGDKTYAQLIASDHNARDYLTRSLWLPNASLTEFNLIYQAVSECGSEPHFLVIPVFLDDTREPSVRSGVRELKSNLCGSTISGEEELPSPSHINTQYSSKSSSAILSENITENLPILKNLPNLNASFRVYLYKLRNTIFGINASSKRMIRVSSYKANLSKLDEMMDRRKKPGMKTLVYIPPLLYSGTKPSMIPYVEAQYKNFKEDVRSICIKLNCHFVNLEDVIPDNEWGTKASTSIDTQEGELDFMHFNSLGHKRFSKMLILEFQKYFQL